MSLEAGEFHLALAFQEPFFVAARPQAGRIGNLRVQPRAVGPGHVGGHLPERLELHLQDALDARRGVTLQALHAALAVRRRFSRTRNRAS